MSTHNIGFYEDFDQKITFQLSSNMHLISSGLCHEKHFTFTVVNKFHLGDIIFPQPVLSTSGSVKMHALDQTFYINTTFLRGC